MRAYSKSCLMFKIPAMLALLDVMLNRIRSNITHRTIKLSSTPEMPSSEICFPKRRESMQYSVCRISLKQLHNLAHRVMGWKFNKKVYMVWLNFQSIDCEVVFVCNSTKAFFTKLFNAGVPEIRVPAFWDKNQMIGALPISMLKCL